MNLTGTIVSGLGEGARYVKRYHFVIKTVLDFEPFPGTLNLRTAGVPAAFLENSLTLNAPTGGLFQVSAKPATINGNIQGAILRPDKTNHPPEILEVIAPVNIKQTLGLKDGDQVEVEV